MGRTRSGVTPAGGDARVRAIAKVDQLRGRRVVDDRAAALEPMDTVGHALQRAAAENA